MKLKNNYKKLLVSEKDLDKLLQLIRSRDLTTADSDTMYAAVKLWLGNVRMRRAVYEELKNRGFSIIRDVSIRSKIIDVYEDLQPALQSTTTVDSEFSKEQILPYYRARFHIVNQDMCVPIDRARTLRDPIYENIVVEKLTRLRHRLLPRYEELISAIEEVCIDINQQIRL